MTIRERLLAYIATNPGDNRDDTKDYHEDVEEFPDILGVPYCHYSQQVDEDIIFVIEKMLPPQSMYSSEIAQEKGWSDEYVELIKYILCGAGLAEYGTSPRGAWIDHEVADLMPAVIARWRRVWADPDEANPTTSSTQQQRTPVPPS